jgi:VWFA-related protein
MLTIGAGSLPRVLTLGVVFAVLASASASHVPDRAAPAPTPSVAPSTATPLSSPSGNLWFIFVDDLHADFLSTGRLRALFKTICSDLIQDGDMTGIVSTGPSSIAIDLTYDRRRVEAAIGRVTGSAMAPVDILRASRAGARRGDEVQYRAFVSISTAYDTMVALAQVHNLRKAFLYVSSGYDIDPSPEGPFAGSGAKPARTPPREISVADVRDQFSALTGQARRSNVRIFAIDPRRVATATTDPGVDGVWWQRYWATRRNSLRALSERTGGFALLEEQDLAEGLRRIGSAMRN